MSVAHLIAVVRAAAPELLTPWDDPAFEDVPFEDHYDPEWLRAYLAAKRTAANETMPGATVHALPNIVGAKPTRRVVERSPYRPKVTPSDTDRAAARAALLRLGLVPRRRS